jgi:hypothetical protein
MFVWERLVRGDIIFVRNLCQHSICYIPHRSRPPEGHRNDSSQAADVRVNAPRHSVYMLAAAVQVANELVSA